MGKKKQEKTGDWPGTLYVTRERESDGSVWFNAHVSLDGLEHGAEVVEFALVTGIKIVEVSTTLKERD